MNEQDMNDLVEAGKVTAKAIREGRLLIKKDVKIVDVLDQVEEIIKNAGAGFSFPAQISVNEIAAHFCPKDDDETLFKEGDVVKLDCGAHINGWVTDAATTVSLGGHEKLVEASEAALNNAIKKLGVGVTLGEIGGEIDRTITEYGFKPIKNLSGHGVGKYTVHCPPSVPNFNNGDNTKLTDGMLFAMEPFASTGAGLVKQESNAEIFQLVGRKPVRSMITRKVLKVIESYNGLPFTTRWLTRQFSEPQVNYALQDLQKAGVLLLHPPLPDKDGGFVSQFEHTVLIGEEVLVLTK